MDITVKLDSGNTILVTRLRRQRCNITQLINHLLQEYAEYLRNYNKEYNSTHYKLMRS